MTYYDVIPEIHKGKVRYRIMNMRMLTIHSVWASRSDAYAMCVGLNYNQNQNVRYL